MIEAIAANTSRNELLKIAAGGFASGLLTPLLPQLIDKLEAPGMLRLALVAVPFAVLVFTIVRLRSANPPWVAVLAGIVTMIAFVVAVDTAVWIDGQVPGVAKAIRSTLAGLGGGFVGSGVMALGIALLPAGPRQAASWLPMIVTGTIAGALLAVDTALDLDLTSVLYPVWQAAVGVRLAMALR